MPDARDEFAELVARHDLGGEPRGHVRAEEAVVECAQRLERCARRSVPWPAGAPEASRAAVQPASASIISSQTAMTPTTACRPGCTCGPRLHVAQGRCRVSWSTVTWRLSWHPIPLGRPPLPSSARASRLGLKSFSQAPSIAIGAAPSATRSACPPRPHRRRVWRARPGPDIKETGFEAIRSRCHRHRCGFGCSSDGVDRSVRQPGDARRADVGVRGEVRDLVRLLRPLRLRATRVSCPARTVPRACISSYHGDHDMACEGPTTARDVIMSGTGVGLRLLAAVLALRARW